MSDLDLVPYLLLLVFLAVVFVGACEIDRRIRGDKND